MEDFTPKISVENMKKDKDSVFTHRHTHSFEADMNPQTHTLQVELEDVERTEWAAVKVKHDEDAGKRRTSVKFRRKKDRRQERARVSEGGRERRREGRIWSKR